MEIGKLDEIFMDHIKKISTISINGISNDFEGVCAESDLRMDAHTSCCLVNLRNKKADSIARTGISSDFAPRNLGL